MDSKINVSPEKLEIFLSALERFRDRGLELCSQAKELIKSEEEKIRQQNVHDSPKKDLLHEQGYHLETAREKLFRWSYQMENQLENKLPCAINYLRNRQEYIQAYMQVSDSGQTAVTPVEKHEALKQQLKDNPSDPIIGLLIGWISKTILSMFLPPLVSVPLGPVKIGMGLMGISIGLPIMQMDLGSNKLVVDAGISSNLISGNPIPDFDIGLDLLPDGEFSQYLLNPVV